MTEPYAEAIRRFQNLLARAMQTDLPEPTAMTLATADGAGRPSVRAVLLKGIDERGFVFYTNTLSRKGSELAANPQAALCFFWQPLKEQVTVEGRVEPVAAAEADGYWASRPRESQIGGWASHQSEPLDSRDALMQRFERYQARYAGRDVPRPAHWSGYRLVPDRIEFWTAGAHRLHHRVRYDRGEAGWHVTLLNP